MKSPLVYRLLWLITAAALPALGQIQYLGSFSPLGAISVARPLVGDDETLYVPVDYPLGTTLFALHPSGAELWRHDLGTKADARSIADDGTIYVKSLDHAMIYAIDPDGRERWRFTQVPAQIYGMAHGFDGTIYLQTSQYGSGSQPWNSKLVALNQHGSNRWEVLKRDFTIMNPVVNLDGTVYLGTYSDLSAINPDGTLYWRIPMRYATDMAIDNDGNLYVSVEVSSDNQPRLMSLNPDGTVRWTAPGGGPLVLTADGGPVRPGTEQGFMDRGGALVRHAWLSAGLLVALCREFRRLFHIGEGMDRLKSRVLWPCRRKWKISVDDHKLCKPSTLG